MHALDASPLVAAPAFLDRPALAGDARASTWRDVHAHADEFAARIESGSTICNLCNSRLAFLVVTLAALKRGCVQVLPPSTGAMDLAALLGGDAAPWVVVDDDEGEARWSAQGRCLRFVASPPSRERIAPWSPDWDAASMVLYTSGSTGAPESHAKSLRQLARGAQVLAARLDEDIAGGVAALGQIVCSVAPQHMFGLETSVMFPLVTGTPVREAKPLLPADVAAAFAQAREGAAWIATPLHLRAFAQSGIALPHCRMVLASTMPMSPELAAQAERFSASPVLEIYGSTETGVLAMRRPARDAPWRPVEGVGVESREEGTLVRGAHFTSPLSLADHVEQRGDGTFDLLGRRTDIVKIAGRRASLASLNLCVQDLPGLGDGVLHLPANGADTQRLVLVHSGAALDVPQARRWLRERMDPVFVPRVFIRVERMPRTGPGKISRTALDEICSAYFRGRRSP